MSIKLYDPNDYYNTVYDQKCYLDIIHNVLNNIKEMFDEYYVVEFKQSNGFYLFSKDNYNILTKYPQHYLLVLHNGNKITVNNYTFKIDIAGSSGYILDNFQLMMHKLSN